MVFETYMVEQLKAEKLIESSDASLLEQIRKHRNKAAHPSGIHASAEEARFIFFEVIDKFLSKPRLLTTQAVDSLMIRLEKANFFPSRNIDEIRDIVSEELEILHSSVFPHLIKELIESFAQSNKNSGYFLIGLACLEKDDLINILRKKLIKAKGLK